MNKEKSDSSPASAASAEDRDINSSNNNNNNNNGLAKPAPGKPHEGGGKMLKRAITILIGAPLTFFIISQSKFFGTAVVAVVVYLSSREWSGIKRHLKVAILRKRKSHHHQLHQQLARRGISPGGLLTATVGGGDNHNNAMEDVNEPAAVDPTTMSHKVPALRLSTGTAAASVGTEEGENNYDNEEEEEEEEEEESSALLNLDVKEFDLPVPPLTKYNHLKTLGWSLTAVAAAFGELSLLVVFIMYFLIFVGVTIIAHNRLEAKVEEAFLNLKALTLKNSRNLSSSTLFFSNPATPTTAGGGKSDKRNTKNSNSMDGEEGGGSGGMRFRGEDMTHNNNNNNNTNSSGSSISNAMMGEMLSQTSSPSPHRPRSHAQREQDRFIKLELSVIVNNQPAEQFVDFCLDIFGILWISGMCTPLLVYSTPSVGFAWIVATMIGNFSNDIVALLTGKTVKTIVWRHFNGGSLAKSSLTHSRSRSGIAQQQHKTGEGSGHAGERESTDGSGSKGFIRSFFEKAPHPLYEAISPNKSVEGAVAGVLFNSIAFAVTLLCLLSYKGEEEVYRYNCFGVWLVVGLLMGCAGVVGDLLQSLLKRVSRVKDAGNILPGHGGMLDRIDGLLLTFPLMYISLHIIMLLG